MSRSTTPEADDQAVDRLEGTPLYAPESPTMVSRESRRSSTNEASAECYNNKELVLGVKRKASAVALINPSSSKRARINARNRSLATKKRVTPRGLDILSNLCYDVTSYLLAYIHPKGLCALMRVNRAWRQTLTAPETAGVWKHSMLSAGVPEAPKGVSIITWAFLLFGRKYCYDCRKGRAENIDFVLIKRLCGTCRDNSIRRYHEIFEKYPDIRQECPDFSKMVPYRTDRVRARKYYAAIADKIWTEYCSAKSIVCAIDPRDVETKMAAFRKEKEDIAIKLIEASNKYTQWLSDQKKERLEQVAARKQWIKDSFVEEGYDPLDICAVLKGKTISPDAPITESGWNLIRSLYIGPLEKRNEHRHNERRKEREADSRRMFIIAAYQAYGETLRPAERIKLPNLSILTSFPPLLTLLNEPIEIEITEAQVRETFEKEVPASLANVIIPQLRKAYMEEIMSLHPNSTLARVIQDKREGDPEPLDLAIATFRGFDTRSSCPTYGPTPIFGLDKIACFDSVDLDLAFKPNPEDPFRDLPPFDALSSAITSALVVNILGLNPTTVTSERLDEMGTLFLCESCADPRSATKRYRVLSWRAVVSHNLVQSSHFRWQILSEVQKKLVKAYILAERQHHTSVPGEGLGDVESEVDLVGQIMTREPYSGRQSGIDYDELHLIMMNCI